MLEALAEEVGKDLDPFDLICHVAFDQPPLTRRERAENVQKRNDFTKYGEQARAVLEALLDKYADEGIDAIEDINVLKVQPLTSFGTPVEIVEALRRPRRSTSQPCASSKPSSTTPPEPLDRPHAMSLSTTIKSIQDIMRKDVGRRWRRPAHRPARLDALPQDLRRPRAGVGADSTTDYRSPIPERAPLAELGRRSRRASPATRLLDFVNNELFPTLKELPLGQNGDRRGVVVRERLRGRLQLHEVGHADAAGHQQAQRGIDFNKTDDRHLFGDIYEQILRDLQSAGNAGEFYTPRAVTQFMVDMVDPQLGEKVLDPPAAPAASSPAPSSTSASST